MEVRCLKKSLFLLASNQSSLENIPDQGRSASQPKLVPDPGSVRFHRLHTDEQFLGYLLIGEAQRQQLEHLLFSIT